MFLVTLIFCGLCRFLNCFSSPHTRRHPLHTVSITTIMSLPVSAFRERHPGRNCSPMLCRLAAMVVTTISSHFQLRFRRDRDLDFAAQVLFFRCAPFVVSRSHRKYFTCTWPRALFHPKHSANLIGLLRHGNTAWTTIFVRSCLLHILWAMGFHFSTFL